MDEFAPRELIDEVWRCACLDAQLRSAAGFVEMCQFWGRWVFRVSGMHDGGADFGPVHYRSVFPVRRLPGRPHGVLVMRWRPTPTFPGFDALGLDGKVSVAVMLVKPTGVAGP